MTSQRAFSRTVPLRGVRLCGDHCTEMLSLWLVVTFYLPGWHWPSKTLKMGCKKPEIHHQIMDTINDIGWDQMVMEPTKGENTLDLFLTNHPNLIPRTETLPGIADHDAVYMEIEIHPPPKNSNLSDLFQYSTRNVRNH